jgi:hypothetical protein
MAVHNYTRPEAEAYGGYVVGQRPLTFPYCHRIQFHWRNETESVFAEPRRGAAEWHSILLRMSLAGHLSLDTPSATSKPHVDFVGNIDEWFGSNAGEILSEPWVGVVRLPLGKILPSYLSTSEGNSSDITLEAVLDSDAFLQSAPACIAVFAFSRALATAVLGTLNEMGIKNVAVCNVHHPVAMVEPSLVFDPVADLKVALSKTASIVLLNQQYTRVASLHKLQTRRQKIWLHYPTDVNSSDVELLLRQSITELQIDLMPVDKHVQLRVATEDEFNLLLRRNIVIVDTWTTAALPCTLEALTFQTPFLIRKMPGTIEYMGEDYPLFFASLQSVQNLLDDEALLRQKMIEAHNYLKLLDPTNRYSADSMAMEMMNCTVWAMTPSP